MHNGVIGGFLEIRRKLLAELSDEAYNAVASFHSDSAVSFALFLNNLPNITDHHPPDVLLRALQATIATISRIQAACGVTETSLLNYVISDGVTTLASRYVSSESASPASLYYAEGSAYQQGATTGTSLNSAATAVGASGTNAGDALTEEADYHLEYGGTGARVCIIASEPVTATASDWVQVPRNTALIICREKDGLLTVLHSPLTDNDLTPNARQTEVLHCLEAVTSAAAISKGGRSVSFGLPADLGGPSQFRRSDSEGALSDTPRLDSGLLSSSFSRLDPALLSTSFPSQPGLLSSSLSSQSQFPTRFLGVDAERKACMGEHLLTGHTGPVMALCSHGDMLFSGSTDRTVKVWCLRDCKYLQTLTGHRDPIRALAVSGDALVSAGAKMLRWWSLDDLRCLAVVRVADVRGSIKSLVAAKDGTLYIGGQDCLVKAYSPERVANAAADSSLISPRCMKDSETLHSCLGVAAEPSVVSDAERAHCAAVTCLALCGPYVCSGSSDATIRVWRQQSLEFVRTLHGHRGSVLSLHAIPGLLLSGGRDHLVRVWDVDALVCRRTLVGHTDDVLHIDSFETSEPLRDADDEDAHFGLDDVTSPPSGGLCDSSNALSPLSSIIDAGSPRAGSGAVRLFATASADGSVRVWKVAGLVCLYTFNMRGPWGSSPPVMSCRLAEEFVVAGLLNGNVVLYPAESVYEMSSGQCHGPEQVSTASKGVKFKPQLVQDPEVSNNGKISGHDIVHSKGKHNPHRRKEASTGATRLEREFERALRVFVSLKTVSADPSAAEDCFRGAKFLLRLLESMGAEVKLTQPVEGKNPIVLARLGTDPDVPTVMCYGHYDVQPAMEPEWHTDPFEVAAIDGYLIGRGVSDNKGPVLAFVYAVKELLEEYAAAKKDATGIVSPAQGNGMQRGLPCNVVFLFEGEEENGSIGFQDAVKQNLRWFFGTEVVLISNTLWVGERRPCLTYGMRGMISLSVEVKGPAKDLHSGNEGGVFSEPLADLNKILASLVDSRNNVSVPGFYDDVRQDMLEAALQRLQGSEEFSLESYRRALGVAELTAGRSEHELLTARWCQPTLSIVDVRVGTAADADTAHYRFGPTRFSVIPRGAVGKISIRFVPDQSADTIIERVTAHIHHEHAKLRSGNTISVKVHNVGDWWDSDPGSALMQIAEGAVLAEWGEMPLLVREGGTMPVASVLEKLLGAPALLLPLGQSSDNCHLANERIRRLNLIRGKNVIKNILAALGGGELAPLK